jgi:hypothetical protein
MAGKWRARNPADPDITNEGIIMTTTSVLGTLVRIFCCFPAYYYIIIVIMGNVDRRWRYGGSRT